jgi:hypothetical protein
MLLLALYAQRRGLLSMRTEGVLPHLHDLVLEGGEEKVDNLVLLDGQRVEVDLLHGLDLAGLDETTELGDGLPLLLFVLGSTTTTTATATTTATVTTTVTSTRCESATSCSTVSHCVDMCCCCRRREVSFWAGRRLAAV